MMLSSAGCDAPVSLQTAPFGRVKSQGLCQQLTGIECSYRDEVLPGYRSRRIHSLMGEQWLIASI